MNREDIIRMAREAGCPVAGIGPMTFDDKQLALMLERFAALVASAEREACIKACEQVTADLKNYAPAFEGITAEIKFVRNIGAILGEPFIDAIRARAQA
jgi:hypothetical protein